jgi:hypothetical protein
MTGFLFPSDGGAVVTNVPYAAGASVPLRQIIACNSNNSPKFCRARITNLGQQRYYLRVKSIYGTASVTISGQDSAGNKFELKGAQVVIDSTGKASDILRRIQVRVPLTGADLLPEFAIQSGDTICKLLEVNVVTGIASSAEPTACPIN